VGLSERQRELLEDLRALGAHLRAQTRERHARINPFAEDLADWRGRAVEWVGEDRGITLYDSTTVMGDVEIGPGTWIGPFCTLDGTGGLTIGSTCSISAGVQLLSHDTVAWALTGGRAEPQRAATRIGDRCFLGVRAVVTKGVTVGDGCLVGAGAVVTADVPDGAVVAGVPARRIGTAHVEGTQVRIEPA
jgi:acetyltransferase-like isoleucine patch superfamily enzyme